MTSLENATNNSINTNYIDYPPVCEHIPYYRLKIFIDSNDPGLHDKYKAAIIKQQHLVNKGIHDILAGNCEQFYFDAGFDLYVPQNSISNAPYAMTINHHIKCAMESPICIPSTHASLLDERLFTQSSPQQEKIKYMPTAFYLHPRSSTGTKTPYRLANNTGIIDSGYRGPLIGAFDCKDSTNTSNTASLSPYSRLLQICAPNITWPIFPVLVDSEQDLGSTIRGAGGFGSTGN